MGVTWRTHAAPTSGCQTPDRPSPQPSCSSRVRTPPASLARPLVLPLPRADSGSGVSRVGDASSEGLRFEQRQLGALEAIGKQPAAAALHHGIDEQPVFVDNTSLDQ